jgi:glyoxalase/bleomycin resistance protein/dioxygenase superfamily protein
VTALAALDGLSPLRGKAVGQIGIVVHELKASLERYSRIWPLGSWACYVYGPDTVAELTYRGEPADYSMWIALNTETPQIELIQPLQGESLYTEWLAEHGEGLHHLGVYVESLKESIAAITGDGYALLQSGYGTGLDGDGGYAYFNTVADLGTIVETIEEPLRRREPQLVWPPP